MLVLAVDTTTPDGSTALLKDGRLLMEVGSKSSLTHSERLLPAVDFMLDSCGLRKEDLDGFALAVGPGSFTGIRIGMSTVKALAYASGKPAAPVSALEALAFKLAGDGKKLICPLIDAKKGEVYGGLYESAKGGLREVVSQGVYSPDALFPLLPLRRRIHFIGSGVRPYQELLASYFKDSARISGRTFFIAEEVGIIGSRILQEGKGVDFLELEPLYYRRSQAEEKKAE